MYADYNDAQNLVPIIKIKLNKTITLTEVTEQLMQHIHSYIHDPYILAARMRDNHFFFTLNYNGFIKLFKLLGITKILDHMQYINSNFIIPLWKLESNHDYLQEILRIEEYCYQKTQMVLYPIADIIDDLDDENLSLEMRIDFKLEAEDDGTITVHSNGQYLHILEELEGETKNDLVKALGDYINYIFTVEVLQDLYGYNEITVGG